MKYYKDLIINRGYFISENDLALSISLKENGLVKEEWIEELLIQKDDVVMYKSEDFKVVSVESYRNFSNNKLNQNIELRVTRFVKKHSL